MEYQDFTLELLTNSVAPVFGEPELPSLSADECNIRWRFGHQSGIATTKLPLGIEFLSGRVLNYLQQPLSDVDLPRLSEQLMKLLFPDDVLQAFSTASAECQRSNHHRRVGQANS